MIIKLQSISYTKNALSYCELGGCLLYSNLCFGKHQDIYLQMKEYESYNENCKKKTFHIKMRIAPEDKGKLTTNDWLTIAKKYAHKIGFENNPYAIYIHAENTEKENIHIVASRIQHNNLAVSDSFTHYKNLDFSRAIEKEYGLRKVERKLDSFKKKQIFQSSDKRVQNIADCIEKSIDISDDMSDFIFHLLQMGIKTKKGRGITFVDKEGVHIKGSRIHRNYSLKGIEKRLSTPKKVVQKNKGRSIS